MRRLPQGICNASAEPQRWASQRERGIDWPHWLAAWEIGQEQVIECRLAKGPEVTFKKQIWGETAHGTTHHPLLPLIHMQPDPPPATAVLVFYGFYVSLLWDILLRSQLSTCQTPGSFNRK